jgi:hypothetical protein
VTKFLAALNGNLGNLSDPMDRSAVVELGVEVAWGVQSAKFDENMQRTNYDNFPI